MKKQIINQDNKRYEFTPGKGPDSGLLVKNDPVPQPTFANTDLERKAKVIQNMVLMRKLLGR